MSPFKSFIETITANATLIMTFVSVVLIPVVAYVSTRYFRTKYEKRKDWRTQFGDVVLQLSKRNETSQLAAAVMLRRFFSAQVDKDEFRIETIRVIAGRLKKLPTGALQKTLGDGLAYAGNLNYAELVRTNLQDLYLGVKNESDDKKEKKIAKAIHEKELRKIAENAELAEDDQPQKNKKKEKSFNLPNEDWVLTMDFTDMFKAVLSDALLENIRGFGTIFYCAIMNNTRIKNCEFINANFINADLTNAVFTNVVLSGSNFSGAKNLPEGLSDYLDEDGIFHDTPEVKKNGFTSKRSAREIKNIFFSMPGSLTKSDEYITLHFKELIEELGYNPVYYTRDHYPESSQISKVRQDIDNSVGIIAFGLKQIQIEKGTARPQLPLEKNLSGSWLPTPWNDIEVGMAMMKELPVLLVKDDDINEGVFDSVIDEKRIKSISTKIDIKQVAEYQSFKDWLNMLG